MENIKVQMPTQTINTPLKQKRVKTTLNYKRIFQVLFIFLTVILFAVANVYNNRWGRSVTELEKQISKYEVRLENAKILNQELTNKARLQSAGIGKVNMHYDADSNVVVNEFK